MNIRIRTTTAALVAATALVAGCSSDNLTEKLIERASGGSMDVDLGKGSVKVETEEGTTVMGSGKVPDGWPSDIFPLPDGLEVVTGSRLDKPDGTALFSVLGLLATGSPTEVWATLEPKLKAAGAEFELLATSDAMVQAVGKVGAVQFTALIYADGEGSSLNIVVGEE